MTLADRRKRDAADRAAGQCRGDVGLYVEGQVLVADVAVGDATARSYLRPPPSPPPDPAPPNDAARMATGVPTGDADGPAQLQVPPPRGRRRGRSKRRRPGEPDSTPSVPATTRPIVCNRAPRMGEEVQVPAFFGSRCGGRPQAFRAICAGSLRTTRTRGRGIFGLPADLMSVPHFTFPRPRERHLREAQRADGTPMGALSPATFLGYWSETYLISARAF
jgi:hypothetical protein